MLRYRIINQNHLKIERPTQISLNNINIIKIIKIIQNYDDKLAKQTLISLKVYEKNSLIKFLLYLSFHNLIIFTTIYYKLEFTLQINKKLIQ